MVSTLVLTLRTVVEQRLKQEFKGGKFDDIVIPPVEHDDSEISKFKQDNKLSPSEILTLLIALVPHVSPEFFSNIIAEYLPNGGDFPAFGGVKGKNHRGILPTGETVLYILAGNDIGKRVEVAKLFDEEHLFAQKSVLYIEAVPAGEPKMSGRLIMDEEYVDLFLSGKLSRPKLSSDFPAQRISTNLEWSDLVLRQKTLEEIRELETWLNYNDRLLDEWGMHDKIKPGFRVLFYGPSGTGKTMTTCLLGKYTRRDVYRVDLSMVISKYIGETEKNLSGLFNKAEHKDWILFFDEADSLFGKRTNVRDAHDKYANQEVSYLLQRIEAHRGLVILASNMKGNIDSAFTRRFNAFVEFVPPEINEREKLWQVYMPPKSKIHNDIQLDQLAKNYELTGANIVNIIQYAGLLTVKQGNVILKKDALLAGIKKEYKKEGKILQQ
ncbi:ATP-binding protein [Draconibacterium sp. IB214405]|uniref:ATP-binding protein n=1 Tax=Draconibacterium sp. IB214405 TaxID=3097352 RepID=UPI002A135024|nr:ATP-binding protein [Draconibacterium sp. IB214405]MDX8339927.1 ATP-binding protein [Draconibacterium sp. IB214405]